MSGACLNHIWCMFNLAILPDWLGLWSYLETCLDQGWTDSGYLHQNRHILFAKYSPVRLLLGFPNHLLICPWKEDRPSFQGQRPLFLSFKLTWEFLSLQGQIPMFPQQQGTTSLVGLWIRLLTGGRYSNVNCLSPEAKATAGQELFSSAKDVAKIRLSGSRN